MTQWSCTLIRNNSSIKCIENQGVIVRVSDNIGNDSAIIQVKDCTQINLVDFDADEILKLCHISQPFLVRSLCCKFSVQDVFRNELRVCCLPGTTVIGILDCGFNIFLTANPQHPLVICFDVVISFQVITYSAVALIRAFYMDLFNFISDSFIFCLISRNTSLEPFIVSRP